MTMQSRPTSPDLLMVEELANRLRVKPSWVYAHADDLGAYRLGKYVRFSWPRVLERLEQSTLGGPRTGVAAQ
jgi:hypothetical protein